MKKSIVAGLMLSVALAFTGSALADSSPPPGKGVYGTKQARPKHTAEAQRPSTYFRIPANPVVRDCVHVMFPQCSRGLDPLNDGTYVRY
jgi:hypothetical protein